MENRYLRGLIERNIPNIDPGDYDDDQSYQDAVKRRAERVEQSYDEAVEQQIDEELGK